MKNEINELSKRDLCILITEEDKYGTDILAMSNFFDGYITQMANGLAKKTMCEIIKEIPAADIGIIGEVVRLGGAISKGEFSYVADLDHLPNDIKTKLRKGIYSIGPSKQVEGNSRAVILDENGVRVKDITLKKVQNEVGTIDSISKIANQLQMKQIYSKLNDIEDLQNYQVSRDRDRDIIIPFLDARDNILIAQNTIDSAERVNKIKNALQELTKAINGIYTDIKTCSEQLAILIKRPIFQNSKNKERFMGYLAIDLQMVTKMVAIQMYLYDYLEDISGEQCTFITYKSMMKEFVEKPIGKRGLSVADILQEHFPYTKDNLDLWLSFKTEVIKFVGSNMISNNQELIMISVEE